MKIKTRQNVTGLIKSRLRFPIYCNNSLNMLTDFLDKGNAIEHIYLDFSETYAIVCYGKLLVRLDKMGIKIRIARYWLKGDPST